MMGFSKKRFLITLGLSVLVWFASVFIQFTIGYKVKFSLFGGSSCQLTGFPIADCRYSNPQQMPYWIIDLVNITIWFFVLHLVWRWQEKRGN